MAAMMFIIAAASGRFALKTHWREEMVTIQAFSGPFACW
jgi:hypothetical protein